MNKILVCMMIYSTELLNDIVIDPVVDTSFIVKQNNSTDESLRIFK